MKFLLVDDNTLYLNSLYEYLSGKGFEVVGTATHSLEALAKTEMLRPEIILMDVQMDGCDGIETTRVIKRDFPEIEIVMLSISEEDEHLFSAIRAGASGYLLKNMDANTFLHKLHGLAAGEPPLAPGLAQRILAEFSRIQPANSRTRGNKESEKETAILTEKQKEILKLLAQGLTYKEIGERLGVQRVTVRYHVAEILHKLHLANRMQLIAKIPQLNL